MDYDSIEMYRRNKNVVFDGVEGWWGDRAGRKLTRLLSRWLGRTAQPSFADRLVEYPLLFRQLADLAPHSTHLLDFGCVEDLLPLHLCALGFRVTGLDFRPYPFQHERFDFIQADILEWEPPEGIFDAAVSTSTIEHVGLTAYGDPAEPDGDKIALAKLCHAVRPGGRIFFTVPAGKATTTGLMRIYDPPRLHELAPDPELVCYYAKKSRSGDWCEVGPEVISNLEYEDYNASGAAQGVAFVILRTPEIA